MSVKILTGDSIEQLKTLPSESVNMCVTSPPYFGLRDYGMDGQIGLEPTPDEFIARLVDVFREVRRVLRSDGTAWVNMGDSYYGGKGQNGNSKARETAEMRGYTQPRGTVTMATRALDMPQEGLKPKDLLGIPWMLAFALRADGWWLRQDIIWGKPNPMPESVTDRCTKAHEYIFLLSKSANYYYDKEAIAEPLQPSSVVRNQSGWNGNEERGYVNGPQNHMSKFLGSEAAKNQTHRNKRSVWTVATQPFKEAHFATFPPALIEPCILAGCPPDGIVLDPFFGAGTTGLVADRLQRNCIGIELNPKYAEIAKRRIQGDAPLFTQVCND